ncbi:MAG: helix-turn-helix transcriptional regulator [Eubacteriales bacterium]
MRNNIKQLRKDKGLRQEDMAVSLNISRQTIIAIENNKYNPTLELAIKMARLLYTTVEELFILD